MTMADDFDLHAELAALRNEIGLLRDEADIRRLQYLYGYFDDYRDGTI